MKKRRTEITIETHELLTVRVFRPSPPAWCADCLGASRLLSPDEAARLCRVGTRAVYGWVAARRIHFKETDGGGLFVCLDSCMALCAAASDETL